MSSSFEVIRKALETDQDRHELYGWGEDVDMWDVFELGFSWRPQDHHFIGYNDGKAVAHVGVLLHVLDRDDGRLAIGGVKSVLTVPEARRKGYASIVLNAARDYMRDEMPVDFGLLFCKEMYLPFYGGLGWERIHNEIVVIHPQDGKKPWPREVMIYRFSDRGWPPGTIDLDSEPY